MRLAAFFTAISIVILAGASGAAARAYLGLGTLEAAALAAAVLVGLMLLRTTCGRIGSRSFLGRQLADLARGGADVARQVAEMDGRLAALEEKVETALDHSRAITDPLALELEELGTLLKRLAETVASQQTMLEAAADETALPQNDPAGPPAAAPAPVETCAPDVNTIRSAVEADRVEIYLQPIVALPQRKVRFYEALARLRREDGAVVHPSDFVPLAESSGLMPQIDNRVMFRCVQAARRLTRKGADIGVFCSLSQSTLAHGDSWAHLVEFMAANRALASSLILQFTQRTVRDMGAQEHESLAALRQHGFGFCMSDTGGLRLEPGELAHRGFGYIKMRRDVLLNPHRHAPGDIDPAELCDLLGRFGIALIVDGVEDEGSVVELLDHDVRFAQGGAFSPPRPVRADALQAVPDAPGAVPAEDDLTTDRLQGADTLSSEATSSAVPTSDAEKGALRA